MFNGIVRACVFIIGWCFIYFGTVVGANPHVQQAFWIGLIFVITGSGIVLLSISKDHRSNT